MHVDDEDSSVLEAVHEIFLADDDGAGALELRGATRTRRGRWRISLAGVDSRERAAALTGMTVMVERQALGLEAGEILVSDLPGRKVVAEGVEVGSVHSSYNNGAHDVIVVQAGERLVDVPLVEQHVSGPDDRGRLVVDGFHAFAELAYPPPGGRRR